MGRMLIIGLDIGTTNVKAVAYHVNGERLAKASQMYPTSYPHPGWAEQSPFDWQETIKVVIRQLVTHLGDDKDQIAAMGLSAHAPSLVPVDSGGLPLIKRIPIWQDERSVEQGERLLQEIGSDWVGLGMPFAAFPAKLKWFTETYPELAEKTQYALGTKAYLVHWLTGSNGTDPSSEPGRIKYWEGVCSACNWSLDRLVPVLPASHVIGEIRKDLNQELGFIKPVPVVLGLNDGASTTLGNGGFHEVEGVITLATNGVIFLVADQPIPPDMRLEQTLFCWPYVGDRWIIGGQSKTGASSLEWLLGIFKGGKPPQVDFEKILFECRDKPPGSEGVRFFPYLMGRGTPKDDPSARAGFVGLRLQTDQADMTQAVLEGVAFTLREVLDTLTRNDLKMDKLMVTGGGARSEVWRQILADVLNRSLKYSNGDSCLGAAILAAVGVGLFPSITEALEAMRSESQEVHPHPEAVEIYEKIYGEYKLQRDALLGNI